MRLGETPTKALEACQDDAGVTREFPPSESPGTIPLDRCLKPALFYMQRISPWLDGINTNVKQIEY